LQFGWIVRGHKGKFGQGFIPIFIIKEFNDQIFPGLKSSPNTYQEILVILIKAAIESSVPNFDSITITGITQINSQIFEVLILYFHDTDSEQSWNCQGTGR